MSTKEFAFRFMAFKEGVTAAKVTFTNEGSGEYLFHELRFTSTAPDIQVCIIWAKSLGVVKRDSRLAALL